jgi:hypothetical protein
MKHRFGVRLYLKIKSLLVPADEIAGVYIAKILPQLQTMKQIKERRKELPTSHVHTFVNNAGSQGKMPLH